MANSLLLIVLAFVFFSCGRNTGNRNTPLMQVAPAQQNAPTAAAIETATTDSITGAPELQRVMPNSWRRLNRMTPEEVQSFVGRNQSLIDHINQARPRLSDVFDIGGARDLHPFLYGIFTEQIGETTFYRIINTIDGEPDFFCRNVVFSQALATCVFRRT